MGQSPVQGRLVQTEFDFTQPGDFAFLDAANSHLAFKCPCGCDTDAVIPIYLQEIGRASCRERV